MDGCVWVVEGGFCVYLIRLGKLCLQIVYGKRGKK
ncbi:hypothetical protein SLEP1_g25197 [Rubroshorea leprosula]|uniref:Uncharacterized protein n=1 Tax=Rubroshorea leprosula TaxID=152421 RepID=A0AAV5JSL7_9ROSI|nr:hypothetical protein SLEP1_g25197 [Rubroshorea leprosula]